MASATAEFVPPGPGDFPGLPSGVHVWMALSWEEALAIVKTGAVAQPVVDELMVAIMAAKPTTP